jgi:hypothetical protein
MVAANPGIAQLSGMHGSHLVEGKTIKGSSALGCNGAGLRRRPGSAAPTTSRVDGTAKQECLSRIPARNRVRPCRHPARGTPMSCHESCVRIMITSRG